MRSSHARRRRAIIALALAAWSTVGCTVTRAHVAPYQGLASPRDDVTLTLASGDVHHLWSAVVRNDSIVGRLRTPVGPRDVASEEEHWRRYRETPVSVPLSSVRTIEVRQVDGGRTALLVMGILGAIMMFMAFAASQIDTGLSGSAL